MSFTAAVDSTIFIGTVQGLHKYDDTCLLVNCGNDS